MCSLIHAIIQDQALVASKHFLIETENKNVADNAEVGRVVYFFIWVCVLHSSIANPKVRPETYSGDVNIILKTATNTM